MPGSLSAQKKEGKVSEKSVAKASPSKLFFVSMLTRDIELSDAILDLLDNCVDGVQRTLKGTTSPDKDRPYAGFTAKITLSPEAFVIEDNCGGIPRETAEEYAFRLGRPDPNIDKGLATVGMYGIGMKRAMFKMGRNCEVWSINGDDSFTVTIPETWLTDDNDWELPIVDKHLRGGPKNGGTKIRVTELHIPIRKLFSPQAADFVSSLHEMISTYYAYILHKGFEVRLNGTPVVGKAISILTAKPGQRGIEPYMYRTKWHDVDVSLIVGLISDIPSEEDAEEESSGKAFSGRRANAGWTVLCNERVVLYGDKSIVTGWGEAGVPAFHSQFRGIAGLVQFESKEPLQLPVTTTKRGIDAQSELYLQVKEFMREGLKKFTNFTNEWKVDTPQRRTLFSAVKAVDALHAMKTAKNQNWSSVRKSIGGQRFSPELPKPPRIETSRKIVFTRPIEEIATVAEHLLDDADADPSVVGQRCFDIQLKRARKP